MRFYKILIIISYFALLCSCNETDHSMLVKQGPFRATITETGELQAISSRIIMTPVSFWEYGQPKLTELIKEGTIVKRGDFIGQLDTSGITKTLVQKRANFEIALADYTKLLVNQESQEKVTLSELQSAEAALRKAQIDTQRVRFESDAQKEISRHRYRIAEIDFKRTQNKIKHSKIIKAEELKIQKQKIERLKREIEKAENAIERYSIYAPSNGMIEYQINRRNRQKIRVGDNIGIGDGIVGLPDLSQMKAVTSVNEKDIDKIQIGQKVYVKLDAFPKEIFDASVIKISRMCKPKENKSKIKVFDIEVLLKKSAPILRPGMTVSCEIVIADFEDALFVDHDCISQDENGYFLLIDNGSEPKKVKITLGPKNTKTVVVNGDLKAGDKIIVNQNTGNV